MSGNLAGVEGGNHIPTIPVLKRILAVLDEELLVGIERQVPDGEPERYLHFEIAVDLRCATPISSSSALLDFGLTISSTWRSSVRAISFAASSHSCC